jgi:predicted AAA+ superfamily ATPase
MELRRKIYDKLLEWKNSREGKTAMLIEGARRVGKTHVALEFAKTYKSYIFIDFSSISEEIKKTKKLLTTFSSNLDTFFLYLEAIHDVKLHKRESLIIFDEVQFFPKARQLIKHLVADGRYDYIETGSLISIKKNIRNILIPSEENRIQLLPLDFEEFLWALSKEQILEFVKKHFDDKTSLGQEIHHVMMDYFKRYMLVGGMPQAVIEYIKSGDFGKVDKIKKDIIALYKNDLPKIKDVKPSKMMMIFDDIPAQLSKHDKVFRLSDLSKNAKFRDYENAFTWLKEAMIVNNCFSASDPHVGLNVSLDRQSIKCYMADTGLLFSHALGDNEQATHEVYREILLDKLQLNEGIFLKNIVAQMLVASGKRLFFYSRYDKTNSNEMLEIDFLITSYQGVKFKVCPIEVKSSKKYSYSSLIKFKEKFSTRIGTNYIIHTKDLKVENGIVFLPIYMTMFL